MVEFIILFFKIMAISSIIFSVLLIVLAFLNYRSIMKPYEDRHSEYIKRDRKPW